MAADLIQESSSPKSIPLGYTLRYNPDGTPYWVPQVDAGAVSGGGGGGGGTTADKEIHVTTYRVKTAFPGGAVGQMVSAIRAFDVLPSTIYQVGPTFWLNETTGTPITDAPPLTSLEQPQTVTGGLTNAEFVAGMASIAKEAKQPTLTADGRMPVDASGTVQAVSAQSLPLPANAATETTAIAIGQVMADIRALVASETSLVAVANLINTLNGKVSTATAQATLLTAINELSGKVATSANQGLQTGAATSAKQDALQAALDALNTKTPALNANNASPVAAAGLGEQNDAAATSDTGTFSLVALIKRLLGKLPASLGIKTSALSLSVAPASDANIARETYSAVTIVSKPTAATGTDWVTFDALAATSFDLVNPSLADIEYRRNGAGTAMPILAGGSRNIQGITNLNQISFRRRDVGTTVVTVFGEGFAV